MTNCSIILLLVWSALLFGSDVGIPRYGGAHSDELEERVRLFPNIASQETSYKLILHMIDTVVAYGQLSR
jgi:hypothetical protein